MKTASYFRSVLFILSFMLLGCGSSALTAARKTIVIAGQAWMEVDSDFSVAYERARIEARETSSTWEERDAKLEKWEEARKAVVASGLAIKSAALAVSIADDGYTSDWSVQLKKMTEAIKSLYQALQVIGIEIPDAISKFTQGSI